MGASLILGLITALIVVSVLAMSPPILHIN